LVSGRRLSASSQNQALNALVILYAQVLDAVPENHLEKFALLRSTRPKRVPTVLSGIEVRRVIEAIPKDHISRLMTELMYGTGMRVGEVCTLRLRDIDVDRAQIIIRSGKGDKDRIVMLPASLRQRLIEQAAAVEGRWQKSRRVRRVLRTLPARVQRSVVVTLWSPLPAGEGEGIPATSATA
jgi:integrase